MFLMPLNSPCSPKRNLPGRNSTGTEQGKLITDASGWERAQDGPRHMSSKPKDVDTKGKNLLILPLKDPFVVTIKRFSAAQLVKGALSS